MKARVLVPGVLVVLLVGGAIFLLLPKAATADFTSDSLTDLVAYVKGDHPDNLKLCALRALRKKTDSGVETELGKLAKATKGMVAIAATTQLGAKKSDDAKKELKSILTDTKVATSVRIGALSAIAYGWKDSKDLTDLESKTKDDSKLSSQLTWLKTNVYEK